MRESIKGVITRILNNRFSFLFLTIVLLFVVRPFIQGATALNFVTNIFLWLVLISCVWAVSEKRKHQKLSLVMVVVAILAIVAILSDLLDFFLQNAVLSWMSEIATFLFLGYAVFAILLYLVRQEEVTAEMIMAAASEYVLIGLLFAFIYLLIEVVYPGSFSFSGSKVDRAGFLYFSFVTLTTTGYGDVLPVTIQARSLATFEAITGQLYMAITVARLVGLYTVRKKEH